MGAGGRFRICVTLAVAMFQLAFSAAERLGRGGAEAAVADEEAATVARSIFESALMFLLQREQAKAS